MIRFETITVDSSSAGGKLGDPWIDIRGADISVNPAHVVALAEGRNGVIITLITGREWRVPGTLEEVEAKLWPLPSNMGPK